MMERFRRTYWSIFPPQKMAHYFYFAGDGARKNEDGLLLGYGPG